MWCYPGCILLQAILGGHLAQLNRENIVQAFGESLTDATLQLYATLLEALPPTPSRFHYGFNLRDLSRVYEGLLRASPDTIQAPADFLRLWRNEVGCAACAQAATHGTLAVCMHTRGGPAGGQCASEATIASHVLALQSLH